MVNKTDAIEIITYAEENEINIWIDGGWGVDALLEEETREKDKEGNSQRAILIRGDRETEFRVIKEVMFECAKNKIFKVSFSAELDK